MVSRVYTPLIAPYSRSKTIGSKPAATNDQEHPEVLKERSLEVQSGEGGNTRRTSTELQGIQRDPAQKVSLGDVVEDFRNTMNALGADEQTRSEVAAYLNVVRVQASKDQPEIPFIKHTLRTAANSLDQFIGKALGQPSHVVKEWIDAVLLQDIDYHSKLSAEDTAIPLKTNGDLEEAGKEEAAKSSESGLSSGEITSSTQSAEAEISDFPTSVKSQIKNLIECAKADHQAGKTAEADQKIQESLNLLAGKDRPDWEGKLWQLRGRFNDQAGVWEQAIPAYQKAAQYFETADLPQKQAHALHGMASILEEHGQLEAARLGYQQVVALDAIHADPKTQLRSLNDLGSLYLRQGESSLATQTLSQAASLIQANPEVPFHVQSDIFSNLAAAFRQGKHYPEAIQNYKDALQLSRTAKDRGRYTQNLQHLASVFVEANQPAQAMKALQRLQSLGNTGN